MHAYKCPWDERYVELQQIPNLFKVESIAFLENQHILEIQKRCRLPLHQIWEENSSTRPPMYIHGNLGQGE